MITLALTIVSFFFLTGVAATLLWFAAYLVCFCVLGTRELCKFCWAEVVKSFR